MCGICGEMQLKGNPASIEHIQAMLPKLAKRGPDAEGIVERQPVVFGHRRLSIIDLSDKSKQPMVSGQQVLVFNGTIYNYKILRRELQAEGHTFVSQGDTEVILKAYAQWGEDCVHHLIGMFAFALWDGQRQCVFLARDRMGIKPLYYTFTDGCFRFASNTQALLAVPGVDTEIDALALHHQFTLHAVIPAPRTLLKGIRKLAPAHRMTVQLDGRYESNPYWSLQATRPETALAESEWRERIEQALMVAVKRRLDIADVPVGVLLSGGLDSSLLVGLLAQCGVQDLNTFSIGFEDVSGEQGNEFEYSDQVVERFDTNHHQYLIPNSDVLRRLPDAVQQMAEPMFGQDAVAFYLLAEQVSKEIKVVQSGQGADEVFAGYFWYPRMHHGLGHSVRRFADHYFDRDHDEFLSMMQPKYQGADVTSALVHERLQAAGADEYIDQVLRFDVTTLVVDDPVKRVDNMTMAWGLESRVPFLDHELVEVAARMPPSLKLQNNGKYMLKQIARGVVPDAVIDRAKGYFPMPALKYVKGEFLSFMQTVLNSESCIKRGLYQRDYVNQLLREPQQHFTRLNGSKLWHLALVEYWLQLNVDP